jgi:hypothetical protein
VDEDKTNKAGTEKLPAELHDLLKLANSGGHDCLLNHNYWNQLINHKGIPLWIALMHHCVTKCNKSKDKQYDPPKAPSQCVPFLQDSELYYLSYADALASTISRRLRGIYQSDTVFHV